MLLRIIAVLLLLFLATIGVNWPSLPFNASIADLIFVPLAVCVLVLPLPRLSWQRADLAVVLYLLGALPAIAVSTDTRASLVEFVRQLYLVAIYFVIAILAKRKSDGIIGIGLAIGGMFLSITGLFFVARQLIGSAPFPLMGEVMTLPYLGNVLRLRAFTASEAMLACLLTAAVPFAIAMCTANRIRAWSAACAVMIVAAALTFSHALAGFTVAVVIAAWPLVKARRHLRRAAIAAAFFVVLVLNFAATVSIRSITNEESKYTDQSNYHYGVDQGQIQIDDVTVTYSVMSYARIKQVAWRAFLEHPIAGVGLDRFHTQTIRAFEEGRLTALYREIDPHSALLGRLAECGLIGGLTLLMLWGAWAGMARDGASSPLGYAAGAALAGLVVSSLNADIMNFRFVWVLAGLLRGLQDANGMVTASGRGESDTGGTR